MDDLGKLSRCMDVFGDIIDNLHYAESHPERTKEQLIEDIRDLMLYIDDCIFTYEDLERHVGTRPYIKF